MKYLFVLGRNPILSGAEAFSWLEKENAVVLWQRLASNGLLIELEKEIDIKKAISELGGTIAIGKVLISGKIDETLEGIGKKTIYFGRENKVIYSLIAFAGEETSSDVLDAMKDNFKKEGLKARYKLVGGTIKLQTGEIARGSPEKMGMRDMNYFVFDNKGEINFGAIEQSYDVEEAEKKDMEKPYRRESLAISPRLARILINLSQVKTGETLLDPFCGIGVILGEGLLRGINVLGVDIDYDAVRDARDNIDWLKRNYKVNADFKIINDDSKRIRHNNEISGVACEPSLGRLLMKSPHDSEIERMIAEFEDLIISVLNNVKKFVKKGGKIAFTSPLIKTIGKKRKGCNFERITEETGLNVYRSGEISFPIPEFREDQVVGREFIVLTND